MYSFYKQTWGNSNSKDYKFWSNSNWDCQNCGNSNNWKKCNIVLCYFALQLTQKTCQKAFFQVPPSNHSSEIITCLWKAFMIWYQQLLVIVSVPHGSMTVIKISKIKNSPLSHFEVNVPINAESNGNNKANFKHCGVFISGFENTSSNFTTHFKVN